VRKPSFERWHLRSRGKDSRIQLGLYILLFVRHSRRTLQLRHPRVRAPAAAKELSLQARAGAVAPSWGCELGHARARQQRFSRS